MTDAIGMKTLVAGWFSFPEGHATAGDLLACDLACEWLRQAGHQYQVAYAPPFTGGVDWRAEDPGQYSHVVFVCGPFEARAELEKAFTHHFARCTLIGLNLSMLLPLVEWNPFDRLFERDSDRHTRADIVFMASATRVPVVGVCLVEPCETVKTKAANESIRRLVQARDMAVVSIDTRLDVPNLAGLRSPREVESLIARMDVLITTRLHGMVFALKNGVPVIAIDAEPGAAKITKQAAAIAWPMAFAIDQITDVELLHAFDYCLTEEARHEAHRCFRRAVAQVEQVNQEFVRALWSGGSTDASQTPKSP
jgi:hypothetical protein